jgi:hypothetical protein
MGMLAVAAGAVAHPGGSGPASCQILAPLQTECSTGSHSYATVTSLSIGFGGTYEGEAAAILEWDAGNGPESVTVTCTITGISLPPLCAFQGTPPAAGVTFTHRCTSSDLMGVPPAGQLQCVINHD